MYFGYLYLNWGILFSTKIYVYELILKNIRNTSLVPRARSISPTKIEKLESEVSTVLNCNTRTMCYVRIYLLIALHWDHEINHWHFISSIHVWHSLKYKVKYQICIIMMPCMIFFRKACKSCLKCLKAVYAKLWYQKILRSQVKGFVPLL